MRFAAIEGYSGCFPHLDVFQFSRDDSTLMTQGAELHEAAAFLNQRAQIVKEGCTRVLAVRGQLG